MANDKKNQTATAPTTTTPVEAPKPMTADDKKAVKALFVNAKKAEDEVLEAEKAYDAAVARRSLAVKAILDKTNSKGPFTYEGEEVTIVKRTSKDRGDNYFFRGRNEKDSISID